MITQKCKFMDEEMDWSIPQTVVSDNHKVIVLTDGSCSDNRFGGTVIKGDLFGMYIPDFYKNAYNPCEIFAENK